MHGIEAGPMEMNDINRFVLAANRARERITQIHVLSIDIRMRSYATRQAGKFWSTKLV